MLKYMFATPTIDVRLSAVVASVVLVALAVGSYDLSDDGSLNLRYGHAPEIVGSGGSGHSREGSRG